MSLIDDARRLAEFSAADRDGACVFGCGRGLNVHHARACPWLAMPRIVTALEAAEGFLTRAFDRVFDVDYNVGAPGYPKPSRCRACLAEGSPYDPLTDVQHKPDCRFQALVAALRGEEVTP